MIIKDQKRIADYWIYHPDKDKVECNLCPRHCHLKNGQDGFCQVRGNVENSLYTYNYGKSIEATIESIETEAVYHHSPANRILSMGNIGCMMACSFCQNWQTSQVKHLNTKNVHLYTPEEVIETALKNNIGIISWTYNDPVVWQEFVVETSKLAKLNGIKTLYKSALYIETEPLAELIDIIDIFSISLKSMDDEVYRKITKGRLAPVLKGINQIAKSDKHLEISQLIVTGLNDNDKDARDTAQWIVNNTGADTPLHLVAYHPAFRYDKPRTSLERLIRSRNISLEEGIQYCYLGNMYHDDVSNTRCTSCNSLLIQRFGLTVKNIGLNPTNNCTTCGTKSPIVGKIMEETTAKKIEAKKEYSFRWEDDINSLHVVHSDKDVNQSIRFNVIRLPENKLEYYELNAGIERLIISKSSNLEDEIKIISDSESEILLMPVLDRAHFPVINDSDNVNKYIN